MHTLAIISVALATASAATAAESADLGIAACAAIANDANRLACYDKATSPTNGAPSKSGRRDFTDGDFSEFVKGKTAPQVIESLGRPNNTESGSGGRVLMYRCGSPPSYLSIKDALTGKDYSSVFLNYDANGTLKSVNFF